MSIWRARPPILAISTDTCWRPRSRTACGQCKYKDVRRTKRDWAFYRATAQNILWPHIDQEYQQELQGIADGLKARGSTLDLVGRGRSQRDGGESRTTTFPWLDRAGETRRRSRSESARQLQRVRRHRLLDERPQAGDRAQQLDRLSPPASAGPSSSTSCPRMAITC